MSDTENGTEFFLDTDVLDFDFDLPDFNEYDIQTALVSYSPRSADDGVLSLASSLSTESNSKTVVALPNKANGIKRKRKGPISKYSLNKEPLVARKAPNMSRRAKGSVLCAFPTFDKCDSLVFFPSSMSRFLNTGDFVGLGKLVNTHAHKTCVVSMKDLVVDTSMMVKIFEMSNELHPDSLTCVHDTHVVENSIQTTILMKYTDCKAIYDAVSRARQNTNLSQFASGTRSQYLQKKLEIEKRSSQDQFRLRALTESDMDLTVYVRMKCCMTFDDVHRKITTMKYEFEMTSIQPASQTTNTI